MPAACSGEVGFQTFGRVRFWNLNLVVGVDCKSQVNTLQGSYGRPIRTGSGLFLGRRFTGFARSGLF
jgi:hypothetical protein